MQDRKKSPDQKTIEIAKVHQRIAELEASEADHKRMEEVLQRAYDEVKERETLYRTLVDNIDLGISLIDTDHTIVMVSAAEGTHFNKPITSFIGKKCFREYEKREVVCPHCPGVQAMTSGQPAEVETEGIRDDGSRYQVRLQAFPVFGDDSKVTGFVEVYENITERKQAEEALRESAEQYRIITNTSMDGFAKLDLDGRILDVNEAYCHLLGYSKEELCKMTVADIEALATPDKLKEQAKKLMEVGVGRFETRHRRKDGHIIDVELSMTLLRQLGHILVFLRDITERKQAEDALRKHREHLEELVAERTVQLKRTNEKLEEEIADRKQAEKETAEAKAYLESSLASIPDGVLLFDNQARFSYVNPIFLEWLGRESKDFIGKTLQEISPPILNPETMNIIVERAKRHVKTGESIVGAEVEIIGKEGTPIYISYSAAGIKDQKGNILGGVVFLKDITDLHNLVLIDELTGLYNRRGFFTLTQQQLKLADRTKREMVLLLVDVDHLKWINDTLGHLEGDMALIETAEVLKETLRSSDVIARIGGDEFVVLAIDARKDSVESITARLQKNLDARNARAKGTALYTLSLSIGTASYDPEHPCSIDELLRRADIIMYEQKRGKENINSEDKPLRAVRY